MGNNTSITKKVNFEDIQEIIQKNKKNCLLINTLDESNQSCLIRKTVSIENEERMINTYLRKDKHVKIIIYDKNAHQNKLFKRDFAGDLIDSYGLKLIDYGFIYKRDNWAPQDDITWFLLEK